MKHAFLITLLSLFIIPSTSNASQNGGKSFGSAMKCTFNSGAVEMLPRELCKVYGGKTN